MFFCFNFYFIFRRTHVNGHNTTLTNEELTERHRSRARNRVIGSSTARVPSIDSLLNPRGGNSRRGDTSISGARGEMQIARSIANDRRFFARGDDRNGSCERLTTRRAHIRNIPDASRAKDCIRSACSTRGCRFHAPVESKMAIKD